LSIKDFLMSYGGDENSATLLLEPMFLKKLVEYAVIKNLIVRVHKYLLFQESDLYQEFPYLSSNQQSSNFSS